MSHTAPLPATVLIPFSEELFNSPNSPIRHKTTQAQALEFLQTENWPTLAQREVAKTIICNDAYFAWHYHKLQDDIFLRNSWLKLHLDMYEKEVAKEQQKEREAEEINDWVRKETWLTQTGRCCLLLMLEDDALAKQYTRNSVPADERRRFIEHTVLDGAAKAQLPYNEALFRPGQ